MSRFVILAASVFEISCR